MDYRKKIIKIIIIIIIVGCHGQIDERVLPSEK